MKRSRRAQDRRILRQRKRAIKGRLDRDGLRESERPVLEGANIAYEMAEKTRAIDCGGIAAFHMLVQRSGLPEAIDGALPLLKKHLPYHESDHVLNIAYNILAGGRTLDDIDLLRENEALMDALGTERMPDPTTAGDFTRRFTAIHVTALMDAINAIRPHFWRLGLDRAAREEAIVDFDGTLCPTTGECKQGMAISHEGIWGYHPLLVSLANTQEPLFIVNRPGNRPSHDGFAKWADKAIALTRGTFQRVLLRGDTDFSLTSEFDRWTAQGVHFIFGYDAKPNLMEVADKLDSSAWKPLERRDKRPRQGTPRRRPENVKEAIVVEKGYKNIRLEEEHVSEFPYTPVRSCDRTYRMVVVRKRLSVRQGQSVFLNDDRYFFYITNRDDLTAEEVVFLANDRCNQENLIDQLKNGLNALRAPVGNLDSNWAYMVIASLAWTIKAWFALSCNYQPKREALLKMEFRGFLLRLVRIPAQVVRTGRRVVMRLLGYNEWLGTFLSTFDRIRSLKFT